MTKRHKFRISLPVILIAIASSIAISGGENIPDELISDLKSEEFKVREEAQKKLFEWAHGQVQTRVLQILEQSRHASDPEVRQRSHNVLYALAMDDYLQDGEGFIGIQMIEAKARIPGEGDGQAEVITITRVLRDTPARQAGLRVGDMIALINGERLPVENALASFQDTIRGIKPGTPTRFGVIRDDELLEVELTLGRRPPEQQARFFGQPMLDLNELAKRDQDRFFDQWLEKLEN